MSEPPTRTIGASEYDQAEFAHGVGDIDLRVLVRQLALRAQGRNLPGALREIVDVAAALRMARHDDGEQAGKRLPQPAMRFDHRLLFARMRRCRRDHWTIADGVFQRLELVVVDRRRRDVELQIAGDLDLRRAQLRQAIGIEAGLRKAEIEAAEQRLGGALKGPPAMERTLGDAAIDDDQRNAALAPPP